MKNTNHFLVLVVVFFVLSIQVHKSLATPTLDVLCGSAASGGAGFVVSLLGRFVGNTDCVRKSCAMKYVSSQENAHKKPTLRVIADATSDMLGCAAFSCGQQISKVLLNNVMDENSVSALSWSFGAASGLVTRLVANSFIHGALNCCGVRKQRSDNIPLLDNGESDGHHEAD